MLRVQLIFVSWDGGSIFACFIFCNKKRILLGVEVLFEFKCLITLVKYSDGIIMIIGLKLTTYTFIIFRLFVVVFCFFYLFFFLGWISFPVLNFPLWWLYTG